jgi:hypothetical protein
MESGAQRTAPDDALQRGLEPRPDELDDDFVRGIVQEVSDWYRDTLRDDETLEEPWRAGGEWGHYVEERAGFYTPLREGDVDTVLPALRDFWRGQLGPIVSQYAYYVHFAENTEPERQQRFLEFIPRDYAYWKDMWREDPSVLEVPRVGNPWGLVIDDVLVTPRATRFDNYSRQIVELLRDVDDPVVGEIGGGYGGIPQRTMARDPRLTWLDVDLPETLVIAAYYLKATMPDRDVHLWREGDPLDRDALLAHDVTLAPPYAFDSIGDRSVDLFLNTFSFTEMRRETMERYVRGIHDAGRRYLLHNNVDRKGVIQRGFERTPSSEFPIDREVWKNLYWRFDTWQGSGGDYREALFERLPGS